MPQPRDETLIVILPGWGAGQPGWSLSKVQYVRSTRRKGRRGRGSVGRGKDGQTVSLG